MKPTLFLFLILTSIAFGAPPIQITKSSDNKELDASAEVKAYYLELIKSNASVKRQLAALTEHGETTQKPEIHYGFAEPYVIDWYPSIDEIGAKSFGHSDARFLVIHRLEFFQSGKRSWDSAIVSEFHVIYDSTYRVRPPSTEHELATSKITIQFLGFRNLTLTPTKGPR